MDAARPPRPIVAWQVTPTGGGRRRGVGLTLRCGLHRGPFGVALVGTTGRGLAWLGFPGGGSFEAAAAEVRRDWPGATIVRDDAVTRATAEEAFTFAGDGAAGRPPRLDVRGTAFQIEIWKALLAVPAGATATYGELAARVGRPRAGRAVGAAVGANRVALVIPCHRVILTNGMIHRYRWGTRLKRAILAAEGVIVADDTTRGCRAPLAGNGAATSRAVGPRRRHDADAEHVGDGPLASGGSAVA